MKTAPSCHCRVILQLVLHQRLQGVNDDGDARLQQCGKLIGEGLSTPGREEANDGLIAQSTMQNGDLSRSEGFLPEKKLQKIFQWLLDAFKLLDPPLVVLYG